MRMCNLTGLLFLSLFGVGYLFRIPSFHPRRTKDSQDDQQEILVREKKINK